MDFHNDINANVIRGQYITNNPSASDGKIVNGLWFDEANRRIMVSRNLDNDNPLWCQILSTCDIPQNYHYYHNYNYNYLYKYPYRYWCYANLEILTECINTFKKAEGYLPGFNIIETFPRLVYTTECKEHINFIITEGIGYRTEIIDRYLPLDYISIELEFDIINLYSEICSESELMYGRFSTYQYSLLDFSFESVFEISDEFIFITEVYKSNGVTSEYVTEEFDSVRITEINYTEVSCPYVTEVESKIDVVSYIPDEYFIESSEISGEITISTEIFLSHYELVDDAYYYNQAVGDLQFDYYYPQTVYMPSEIVGDKKFDNGKYDAYEYTATANPYVSKVGENLESETEVIGRVRAYTEDTPRQLKQTGSFSDYTYSEVELPHYINPGGKIENSTGATLTFKQGDTGTIVTANSEIFNLPYFLYIVDPNNTETFYKKGDSLTSRTVTISYTGTPYKLTELSESVPVKMKIPYKANTFGLNAGVEELPSTVYTNPTFKSQTGPVTVVNYTEKTVFSTELSELIDVIKPFAELFAELDDIYYTQGDKITSYYTISGTEKISVEIPYVYSEIIASLKSKEGTPINIDIPSKYYKIDENNANTQLYKIGTPSEIDNVKPGTIDYYLKYFIGQPEFETTEIRFNRSAILDTEIYDYYRVLHGSIIPSELYHSPIWTETEDFVYVWGLLKYYTEHSEFLFSTEYYVSEKDFYILYDHFNTEVLCITENIIEFRWDEKLFHFDWEPHDEVIPVPPYKIPDDFYVISSETEIISNVFLYYECEGPWYTEIVLSEIDTEREHIYVPYESYFYDILE